MTVITSTVTPLLMSPLGHFGRFWHIRRMSGLGAIAGINPNLATC
jgi:hypothetical protein